jgi:hypothetical protein
MNRMMDQLRQEYLLAREAFEQGEGDVDVLIYRLAAAERAYDLAIREMKRMQGLSVHDAPCLSWISSHVAS